jgi:hypothetical protein
VLVPSPFVVTPAQWQTTPRSAARDERDHDPRRYRGLLHGLGQPPPIQLADKFYLPSMIMETRSFNEAIRSGNLNPFQQPETVLRTAATRALPRLGVRAIRFAIPEQLKFASRVAAGSASRVRLHRRRGRILPFGAKTAFPAILLRERIPRNPLEAKFLPSGRMRNRQRKC